MRANYGLPDFDEFCNGADRLFLTVLRVFSVFQSRMNPAQATSPLGTGDIAVDAPLFTSGTLAAGFLLVLTRWTQIRNDQLQHGDQDYYAKRFLKLNVHLNKIAKDFGLPEEDFLTGYTGTDPYLIFLKEFNENKELKDALKYYGNHVHPLRRAIRRFLSEKDAAALADLKNQKDALIKFNLAKLIENQFAIDFAVAESKRRDRLAHLSNETKKLSAIDINAITFKEKFKKFLMNPKEAGKEFMDCLFNLEAKPWTYQSRYMMGFWLTWFFVWAITGVSVGAGVASLGLIIGVFLPPLLVPIVIYLTGKILEKFIKPAPAQSDADYNLQRMSVIETYYRGLNHIFDRRMSEDDRVWSMENRDIYNQELRQIMQDTQFGLLASSTETACLRIKSQKRKLITAGASNFMLGLIVVEFAAWPLTSFLVATGLIAAAATMWPVTVGIIAGVALLTGLYMMRRAYQERKEQYETQLGLLNENQNKISQLIALEKVNTWQIQQIKEQQQIAKEHGIKLPKLPDYLLENGQLSDRMMRRMTFETTHRTYLKKGLHFAYVAVTRLGTGILFSRLFLDKGLALSILPKLIAVTLLVATGVAFPPGQIFIGLMILTGLVWGSYKLYEHYKNCQDARDVRLLKTLDPSIQGEEKRREFLTKVRMQNQRCLFTAKAELSTGSGDERSGMPLLGRRNTSQVE